MSPKDKPLVGIVMGSASDMDVMSKAKQALDELGVPHEVLVASAHRTPQRVQEYALNARKRGLEVIIAGAGWAAHLAGVLAAWCDLPIIAVPIGSSVFRGMDALLSSVMMPSGVPVAVMAVDGSRNAGIFCAQILGLKYPEIRDNVAALRRKQAEIAAGGGAV